MAKKIEEFNRFRTDMNEKLLAADNLQIKRFFNLDTQAYADGALTTKTKELLGLVASAVLRCNDCITYHLLQGREQGVTKEEFLETFNIIVVVGGSITIPHIRHATAILEELEVL